MEKQKLFISVLQLTTNKENIGALQKVGITTTKIHLPHGDIVGRYSRHLHHSEFGPQEKEVKRRGVLQGPIEGYISP